MMRREVLQEDMSVLNGVEHELGRDQAYEVMRMFLNETQSWSSTPLDSIDVVDDYASEAMARSKEPRVKFLTDSENLRFHVLFTWIEISH